MSANTHTHKHTHKRIYTDRQTQTTYSWRSRKGEKERQRVIWLNLVVGKQRGGLMFDCRWGLKTNQTHSGMENDFMKKCSNKVSKHTND